MLEVEGEPSIKTSGGSIGMRDRVFYAGEHNQNRWWFTHDQRRDF